MPRTHLRLLGALASATVPATLACGIALAAVPAHGVTLRATAKGFAESLTTSANGRSFAGYDLNVPERCNGSRNVGRAHGRRSAGSGAPAIPIRASGKFKLRYRTSGQFTSGGKAYGGKFVFSVNGKFTASRAAATTVRITFRSSNGKLRCNSGKIRFNAHG